MFLDSKFLEQVDGLGWGSVALFAVVSGLAAVCTLVVALVAGIGRLRRRLNVQLARLHASLPKSTVTFPIDFKGVGPIADWRRLVYVFVFPIQLVAGFPFFVWAVWHYGIAEAPSSDGYWLFGVPIAPGWGILILSGLPPTPRLVLTNTLLTILWKICWWLETLICVIGVVTLGYVVWSAVASVSLTSIGILIVVLLIVIIHRLSQIHPKITSEDGKASAPAAPGSPESSGGAPRSPRTITRPGRRALPPLWLPCPVPLLFRFR